MPSRITAEPFGGAIKKDKLFYLLGYEGQRYNVGNPKNVKRSNHGERAWVASSSLPDAINDLLTHGVAPSPLSLNLAGCVLAPPVTCTPNKGLFSNNTSSTTFPVDFLTSGGTDNGVGRVDYHLNEHHTLQR